MLCSLFRRRSVWGLALLLSVGAVGCGTGPAPGEVQVENLQLLQRPTGDRVVSGMLFNPGPGIVRGAQVVVGLYGAANEPLDEVRVEVGSVPAGERRSFEQALDAKGEIRSAGVRQVLIY